MKNLTDQEIKKLAEEQLFSALATPPREGLRMDFSAKLRTRLQQKLELENRLRFYGGWGLVFICAMAVLFFSLVLMDRTYETNVTAVISNHKWVFITAFPVLFLIQYLDHVTVKQGQLKRNQQK